MNIFKKVQVFRLHIQDDAVFWIKVQKAVCILACLRDEHIRPADLKIAVDCLQDTADRDGRVCVCRKENLADHRGGRCFSVVPATAIAFL